MRFQEHQLTEYQRHAPDCQQGPRCQCPYWAHGRLHGKLFRKSLGTRSKAKARQLVVELLERRVNEPEPERAPAKLLSEALAEYLAYCRHNRRLKGSTLKSYEDTCKRFEEECTRLGVAKVEAVDLLTLEKFQRVRDVTPKTAEKEFTHIRSFFNYSMEHKWIGWNPAKKIKLPKADGVATLPFADDEVRALIAACDQLGETHSGHGGYASYSAQQIFDERAYARALVILLLNTGLRISDALCLKRENVTSHGAQVRLKLRTEKTGEVVNLPLWQQTAAALDALPRISPALYFWKGGDEIGLATACDRARRVIARLGDIAEVKDARPHRFRDTFAKVAILQGVPLRTIQIILGHRSIATTERHYLPYVREYEGLIDKAVSTVGMRLIA